MQINPRYLFAIFILALAAGGILFFQQQTLAANPPIRSESVVPDFKFQVPIGELTDVSSQELKEGRGIQKFIGAAYPWILGFAMLLAVLVLTFAGLMWMTAHGSSEQVKKAQGIIRNALIGLALAIGSYVLLNAINPALLSIPSLKLKVVNEIDFEFTVVDEPEAQKPHTRKDPIRVILHHTVGNDGGAHCKIARKRKDGSTAYVDCNYFVKTTGEIVKCLDEGLVSEFCTNRANTGSIGIEIVDNARKEFTNAQIETVATLIKKANQRWRIPLENDHSKFDTTGGIYTHADVCMLKDYKNTTTAKYKEDIPDNILQTIMAKVGGRYIPGQPRCGPRVRGTIH